MSVYAIILLLKENVKSWVSEQLRIYQMALYPVKFINICKI